MGGVRRRNAPGGAAEVVHAPLEHGAHVGFEVAVARIVILVEQLQKEALHLLAGVFSLRRPEAPPETPYLTLHRQAQAVP